MKGYSEAPFADTTDGIFTHWTMPAGNKPLENIKKASCDWMCVFITVEVKAWGLRSSISQLSAKLINSAEKLLCCLCSIFISAD